MILASRDWEIWNTTGWELFSCGYGWRACIADSFGTFTLHSWTMKWLDHMNISMHDLECMAKW